jgi:hypothetical protein
VSDIDGLDDADGEPVSSDPALLPPHAAASSPTATSIAIQVRRFMLPSYLSGGIFRPR